jgi:hypothetical protein
VPGGAAWAAAAAGTPVPPPGAAVARGDRQVSDGTRSNNSRTTAPRSGQLLEVVQHQSERRRRFLLRQQVAADTLHHGKRGVATDPLFSKTQRLRNRAEMPSGSVTSASGTKQTAAGKRLRHRAGDLQRKARFSRTAQPGQRDEPAGGARSTSASRDFSLPGPMKLVSGTGREGQQQPGPKRTTFLPRPFPNSTGSAAKQRAPSFGTAPERSAVRRSRRRGARRPPPAGAEPESCVSSKALRPLPPETAAPVRGTGNAGGGCPARPERGSGPGIRLPPRARRHHPVRASIALAIPGSARDLISRAQGAQIRTSASRSRSVRPRLVIAGSKFSAVTFHAKRKGESFRVVARVRRTRGRLELGHVRDHAAGSGARACDRHRKRSCPRFRRLQQPPQGRKDLLQAVAARHRRTLGPEEFRERLARMEPIRRSARYASSAPVL